MTTSELEVKTGSDGRFYKLPNGVWVPSVTTVISEMSDKSGLVKWRKSIGHEAADRYMKHRARIGTNIHDMFEEMMKDVSYKPKDYLLRSIYNKCASDIYALDPVLIEEQVWSERLRIAGRCDVVIREEDDNLGILDFKSYKKYKKESYLENYFIQGACYAMMAYECGKVDAFPKHITIYGTCEDEPTIQRTTRDTKDYVKPAVEMVQNYWKQPR